MLTNREVVLAKIEAVYNFDPAPVAASHAILVENLASDLQPAMIERPAVRASLGKLRQVYGGGMRGISFDVEIKGSGTLGVAPEVGVLLRMCGMGETIVANTSVAYSPASTNHESGTIYYYQDGKLTKLTGAKGNVSFNWTARQVGKASFTFLGHTKEKGTATAGAASTITLSASATQTDDLYNGQSISIIAGTGAGQTRTISDYVGATRIATVSSSWTTNPNSTSVYSIDNGPIDRALPTPSYDSIVPYPAIGAPFAVDGFGAVIESLSTDLGNSFSAPSDISSPDGFGTVNITGRDVNGQFDPEAVLIAVKDFEAQLKASSTVALTSGLYGVTSGNRIKVDYPAIAYRSVTQGDREGVRTTPVSFGAEESTTDNEITITFT